MTPRSDKRLSGINKGKGSINKFLVNTTSLNPKQQHSVVPELKHTTPDNKILDGVVACLDVRTEDGDDVSQNFERALQSMGAKTRRVFSDSCTHLIFKNGSPTSIKKALSRNAYIINLLWISRCKKEGKRLSEEDFVIERPQTLALTAKKRRKSMEPSKVRALDALMEDSNFSPGPTKDLYELRNQRLEEERRKTISTSTLKRRHDERIEALMESEEDEYKLKTRLSLPVEALVGRTEVVKRLKTTPTVAPSPEMKEHIKARFSIGNKVDGEDSKERLFPSISISSSSSQSSQAPLRRKRRLTGNVLPKQNSIQHIPSSSPSSTPLLSLPTLPLIKPNIVFSSLTPEEHTKYSKIVQKLGTFEIAIEVNDRTTHVITGKKRYTKATLLGLVKGLWLLNPEWLSASEKAGKYLREEEYERVEWYPRIEMARKGLSFIPTTSRFKVSSNVGTGPAFIESLIKQAGGNVVKEVEEANLVISNEHMDIDTTVVSEKWVFDSIEQWIYLSTDTYTI